MSIHHHSVDDGMADARAFLSSGCACSLELGHAFKLAAIAHNANRDAKRLREEGKKKRRRRKRRRGEKELLLIVVTTRHYRVRDERRERRVFFSFFFFFFFFYFFVGYSLVISNNSSLVKSETREFYFNCKANMTR